MADRKNQHFVPRVLMRPFTKNQEDKSINVNNIRADRLIPDAPVKGQCSRSYWYGEDGVLEDLLGKLEGLFGKYRALAVDGGNDDKTRNEIRRFMHLQQWRTAKAAERIKASWEAMNRASFADKKEIPEQKELIISAMRFGITSREMVEDLKVRFVENRTNREFVLGDDPSISLNRFATTKLKTKFGVGTAGLIMVMPLTPWLSVIAYDGQVYNLDVTNGQLVLDKPEDVDAFNDIQMLAALENFYFRDWEQGEHFRQQFNRLRDQRKPHAVATTYVPDGDDPQFEKYKPGTVEEARAAKRSLISVAFNYPEPQRWIPGMRFRDKPKFFYNGTGIGHVRKKEWLKRGGMPIPERRAPGKPREKPIMVRDK